MNSNLKKIEIALENCEVIEIPGKYIGDISIKKIKEEINRLACNYIDNGKWCSHVKLEIFKEANEDIEYHPFNFDDAEPIFDRLFRHNDITYISLWFNNNSSVVYRMKWWGDRDYVNAGQCCLINENGDLYIVIDKKIANGTKDIYDFLSDYLLDSDKVNFRKNMYGVYNND